MKGFQEREWAIIGDSTATPTRKTVFWWSASLSLSLSLCACLSLSRSRVIGSFLSFRYKSDLYLTLKS